MFIIIAFELVYWVRAAYVWSLSAVEICQGKELVSAFSVAW